MSQPPVIGRNYELAVLSHRRPTRIQEATLGLLLRGGVPEKRITVFVADEEDRTLYEAAGVSAKIVVAGPGRLRHQETRNFITDYYQEGTELLAMDDDVSDLRRRSNESQSEGVMDVDKVIREGFHLMHEAGATLWGVYPSCDRHPKLPSVTTDLRFVVGAFFGRVLQHRPHERVSLPFREDYEQCVKHYIYAGRLVRINSLAIVTKPYEEPGGLQGGERTIEGERESGLKLIEQYPELVHEHAADDSPRLQLRLQDVRRSHSHS